MKRYLDLPLAAFVLIMIAAAHPGASLLVLARAAVAYIEAPADDANVADLYDELEATTKAWKREIK